MLSAVRLPRPVPGWLDLALGLLLFMGLVAALWLGTGLGSAATTSLPTPPAPVDAGGGG
jgi:hypothetical protein